MKKIFTFIIAMFVAFGLAMASAGRILETRPLLFFNRATRRSLGVFSDLGRRFRIFRARLAGWTPRLVGARLYNAKGGDLMPGMGRSLKLPDYLGPHRFLNSNGDIDFSSTGFKYLIDNLSFIRANVIKQKFYKIAPADFMTVDVGEAPWSSEVIQNLVFQNGGDFYDGDQNQAQGGARPASVDVSLAPVRMPTQIWAKMTAWTIMEIAQAAAASKWDIVSDKLEALKTNWDLGIQRTAFLGHKQVSKITGLLNNANVTISTSLLPTPISKMSSAQFATFVASVLGAYFANSNSTEAQPNRLVIPMSDYLGLATPIASGFPIVSQLTYLEDAFKRMCGPDFKIMGLAYSQAAQNLDAGIGKQRAVLYRDDPEVLKMSIPVDITLLEAASYNKINWEQNAYGQYAGVLVTRPREVLYMDVQTS